jgi:spoIIIJ-associated protein
VEWVETTGRTVEEAKDAALDQLGVDEVDAEFEVLAEPKSGLFGRLRQEARVRARVQPKAPRPKQERRDRKRRGRSGDGASGEGGNGGGGRSGNGRQDRRSGEGSGRPPRQRQERPAPSEQSQPRPRREEREQAVERPEGANVEDGPTLEEQADIVRTFVEGLVDAFGADATTTAEVVDDDTIDVRVEGADVGLLIGPKGQTLTSILELSRTVVQRHGVGAKHGRVQLDIGGYRERRRVALERFTRQVAEQVLESGSRKVLEPMNAADRKIVHDTANEIVGVRTVSEGEEPRRRVVLEPDPQES